MTKNKRFCSRSCSAQVTNREVIKRSHSRICKRCGNRARSYKSDLCEEHFQDYLNRFKTDKTIGEYRNALSVKGKHGSWLHSHVRNFARSWNKHLLELPCARCGYSLHVELAHIIPVASFEDLALLSEVNSEKNIVQLCRNCHWEFDNGLSEDEFIQLIRNLGKNHKQF